MTAITLLTTYRLIRIAKYQLKGLKFTKIYLWIVAWFVIQGGQWLYAIVIYWCYIDGANLVPSEFDGYSRNYARFATVPGFIIQTIFMEICWLFFEGLTNCISISIMKPW